jgi:membrane peptidoglycan carboxypeptidase
VRLGMTFNDPVTQHPPNFYIDNQLASFTYGTDGVSPLDLSTAYATLAARGTKCDPTPVTAIIDGNGRPATDTDGKPYDTGDHCTPNVIAPGIADTLNQMLRNDVEPGHPLQTGPRAYIPGHQIAGKTGTVNEQDSVTFVGSTPEYTATAMVFRARDNLSLNGYGGNMPATIWHDTMEPILANQPTAIFPDADPQYAGPRGVNAPPIGVGPSSSSGTTNRNNGGTGNGGTTTSPASPSTGAPETPAPDTAAPPADQTALPPDTNGDGQPG